MRLITWVTFCAFSGLLFTGCSQGRKMTDKTATRQLDSKYWRLLSLMDSTKSVAGSRDVHILFTDSNRVSGFAGCNGFFGNYSVTGDGKISCSELGATMMACQYMATETKLIQALQSAQTYTIQGDTLVLKKDNQPLAAFLGINKAVIAGEQLNGTWEPDYIAGATADFATLYPDRKPVLELNLPDERISGYSSCNSFGGIVEIKDNQVSFSKITSTLRACPGTGESLFINTLKSANKYAVSNDGQTLTLITGDIAIMRLVRK